jgi:hypothetical protein
MTITLPPGLATLATVPNWVNWNLEPRPGDPKPTKVPYTPSLAGEPRKAKAGEPATWGDFATAAAAAEAGRFTGLGFEFHAGEGHLLFDLDHVIDDAGKIAPVARAIMALANSYSEPSPSNTGIRIIAKGELPRPLIAEDRQGKKKGGFELYGGAHFGTLTCRPFKGYDQLRAIDPDTMVRLFALMWPEDMSPKATPVAPLPPLAAATGDDAALLEQACTAKNGADFHARQNGAYLLEDRSADDFAYLMTLAFWTQNDAHRMRRIALASGRVREKWLTRRGSGDLLDYSIAKACTEQHTIYDPGQRNGARFVVPETGEVVTDFAPLVARFTRELAERDRDLARAERLLEHCRDEHKRKDRHIADLETENAALEAGIKHPDQAAGVGAFDLIEAAERARKKGDILTRDGKDYARVPFKQAVNRRSQTTLARGFKSIHEAGKLDAFTRTERVETATYKGNVPIAYIHIPPALHGRRGAAVLAVLPEVTEKKHGGRRTIDVPPEVAAQPNPVKRERELVTRWYDALNNAKIVTDKPESLGTDYWTAQEGQRSAQWEQRTAAEIEALRVGAGYQPAPTKPWQPTQPALQIHPDPEPFHLEMVSLHPEPFQDDAIDLLVNRRHLETVPPAPVVGDIPGQCADADCTRRAERWGYCEGHYEEYSRRYAGAYDAATIGAD